MFIRLGVLVLCLAGCVADPDAPQMMGEQGEPEERPPEERPPEERPPEELPPEEHWLMTCFGIDVALTDELQPLIPGVSLAQPLADRSVASNSAEMSGMISVFDARFAGRHYIQVGSHAELILLRPDCTVIEGADPGNNYAEAVVELDADERLYLITRRGRPEPTARLVPPALRPEAFNEAEELTFQHAAAYLHPQASDGSFVLAVEAQWQGSAIFRIRNGEEIIELGHRYWSSGETYWWETQVYLPEQPQAGYQFELADWEGVVFDSVDVEIVPVALKDRDESCDPVGIRSICAAGLTCTGRICHDLE